MADPEEKVAISLLSRAVALDKQQRFTESLICYEEGIQILTQVIRGLKDPKKKSHFSQKANEYLDRAEHIKNHVHLEKSKGNYHEKIRIEDGAKGFSYQSVFGRFLSESVLTIDVEDPYIRTFHQLQNFVRFCEVVCRLCPNLKKISLITGKDSSNGDVQINGLSNIRSDLEERGITMDITFSETLHDREIRLDAGWIIKIGRGLDYFKPPKSKWAIGYYDLDLRPCHESTIDIYHRNNLAKNT
ncbi:MIT domain-containing protein 1-like [Artemia franciscana]|uniref:MIT domain-containing protein n=1 Tax=Artemia franciscana TaxID=6661 RepID=A0AA88L451_ARTSF|nr:hypothetical protein QYM36_011099 [Artemia franciscana]KAK2712289.1 hypothetical protein QYM36_011099 [Artemia franciscana]